MAFSSGTASGIADLMSDLSTFAQANGWTEDHSDVDRLFLSKSTVFVSFRWATSSPLSIGIYHALGFSGSGTDPGNHTDDSGQGVISGTDATIATGRQVQTGNGSMNYWFFEDDTYIHVVVEIVAGTTYRHFGFGIMSKFGTWTGGEYCYGQRVSSTGSASALKVDTTTLMDGFSSGLSIQPFVGSVHLEGFPGSAAGSKWGLCWNHGYPTTNDRGGNERQWVVGGTRGGPSTAQIGRFSGTPLQGLVPLVPLNLFMRRRSGNSLHPLGTLPDVRQINIKAYAPGDEIANGSDTWVVFPGNEKGSAANTGTRNFGIAYKKVTT